MPVLVEPTDDGDRGLSTPQLRVLQVLSQARGPITRTRIAERAGITGVLVGKAVGKSDPVKRAEFEQTQDGGFRLALLSLGYVREFPLDVEGLEELVIEITPAGREAFSKIDFLIPPPKKRLETNEVE